MHELNLYCCAWEREILDKHEVADSWLYQPCYFPKLNVMYNCFCKCMSILFQTIIALKPEPGTGAWCLLSAFAVPC